MKGACLSNNFNISELYLNVYINYGFYIFINCYPIIGNEFIANIMALFIFTNSWLYVNFPRFFFILYKMFLFIFI